MCTKDIGGQKVKYINQTALFSEEAGKLTKPRLSRPHCHAHALALFLSPLFFHGLSLYPLFLYLFVGFWGLGLGITGFRTGGLKAADDKERPVDSLLACS